MSVGLTLGNHHEGLTRCLLFTTTAIPTPATTSRTCLMPRRAARWPPSAANPPPQPSLMLRGCGISSHRLCRHVPRLFKRLAAGPCSSRACLSRPTGETFDEAITEMVDALREY